MLWVLEFISKQSNKNPAKPASLWSISHQNLTMQSFSSICCARGPQSNTPVWWFANDFLFLCHNSLLWCPQQGPPPALIAVVLHVPANHHTQGQENESHCIASQMEKTFTEQSLCSLQQHNNSSCCSSSSLCKRNCKIQTEDGDGDALPPDIVPPVHKVSKLVAVGIARDTAAIQETDPSWGRST